NKKIKLGLFLKKAVSMGADFVATGHYAKKNFSKGLFRLLKAKDKEKDQSYFLWKLNQKQLGKILFPIGDYTKAEVRSLAKKHKLATAKTKESQNLCFLADNVNSFLKANLKMKPGKIIDVKGTVIGKHQGLGFYTIGQRWGIGPDLFSKYQSQGPFYVLKKEAKKNTLIATTKKKDLFKKELIAAKLNWISGRPPKLPLKVKARIRSRQKQVEALIFGAGKKIRVNFKKPERAITPGQSIVFYKGEKLLGGGVICG
ncbi:tRNA 2-thiouridine(34) synthase MnmA, partial [Candidatus Parcubacteria bacterium]|nr:tRNA 2-thiouridine(34) synthase MnmA [Patescibacteria group bacterium]MCG2688753.1 tRNA 2-thiouridine(34) synthase MnmA [Candidatus Parcubacteria bacterium]